MRLRPIKHIIQFTIILLLVLYFGIIGILNVPYIQRQMSVYTSQELSKILQTEVNVGNIDLGLLNRIIIQNVTLQDRQGKELLKVARLSAKFDIHSLVSGKIRISSVQLFGLNAHLNRPTPDSAPNFQFILDTFASKDTVKKESNIDLRINAVLIRRGQIHYDLLSAPATPGVFNGNHIGIENLSATLSLKAFSRDSLNAQIRRMSFNEQSGFTLKKLALKLTANRRHLAANHIEVALPQTLLQIDTIAAFYNGFDSLPKLSEQTRYMGKLHAEITPSDIASFVPALQHFHDPVTLRLAFKGKGNRTECTELYVTNPSQSLLIKGNAAADLWNSKRNMYLSGNLETAQINKEGVQWLLQNLTGKQDKEKTLERLDFVRFNGNISGHLQQLTTKGSFTSNAGTINGNVTMHTDTLTGLRSYSGKISSKELNLGILLNQEKTLGKTCFDVELKGFKYRNNKPESYIKGNIASFEYKQYEYHNISLDGQYTRGGFNGRLALNDPNGNIEINGKFVTSQQTPDFNLRAVVQHFRPNDLNLTTKYKNKDLSLSLTADFSGHSIDDMQGKISIDSLLVNSTEEDQRYFLPNLSVTAGSVKDRSEKQIRIDTPFIQGSVEGNYSYRTLLTSILKTAQRYVPALVSSKKKLPETNNNFRFRFALENAEFFSKVLDMPVELSMPANISGYFDDEQTRLQIRGYVPKFTYNGSYYESGVLLCENSEDMLQCHVRANKRMKKGAMVNLALTARAKDDKLRTTINWGNNTSTTFSGKVEALAHFKQSEEKKQLHTTIDIQPSQIILNDTVWRIHPAEIIVEKNNIEVNNFLFEHADQHLRANGKIGKEETDSCIVDLKNINLQYIMDIIEFHAVKFNGMITGKVHLNHVLEDPVMHTRLDVKGFSLNDALLGRADITGKWDKELGGVRLFADIKEDTVSFTKVNGYVSPKMKGLDLHIQAGGTNLALLQPFIEGIFSNVQGRTYGNIRLFGPFSQLDLEGTANANVSMKVNILNTSFQASCDSLRITPGHFAFRDVRLTDPEGHTGTVNGDLNHTKLKNLLYRFRFDIDNMLVYKSEKETPDFPFYGQIYTSGNVSLQGGGANGLSVDGNLRTDAKTSFVYVTTTAAEATSSQFITFVDRTPHRLQENIQTDLYHHLNEEKEDDEDDTPGDIRLNLQIEATPAATMKIVMDPAAGDYISANGTGNLRINFFNKGDFQMFGNYNIEEGIYKMSMQNIIRKDFILQSGGTVSFNGNPKQANLNVQAIYTVNSASLNDLIADASTNKGTVRVNCILNLSGNLTAPTLTFDLDLPTVSDEDRELVRSLTNTEEQMNTQIIYLLGIGKFYTYDYANNAQSSNATSSLAFSTLSGQLNNMLSQVIDSQNWNVGTSLSTGQEGWTDVEAEAILSGRLLNNRLIINGNFGYRDNPMRNTNFVGDFEAMWLLTKNGEFRLKGYNETNDRYFTKSTLTTQGIGFMYKKDFTNWRELFDWIFLRRRGKRSSKENASYKPEAIQPTSQDKKTKNTN